MDIAEISQIVSGLCLQTREDGKPRLDPGAVNTLALAAPYDELVKGAQEGLPPASLIQKAGLETYRTALMAAGEIGAGEDVGPYLDLLNHTSALYTVGTQYLKLANKMVRGDDVTPAQLNTLSARLADNRAFEFQYGDEVEAEAAIWEPTGWNAWDQGFGGVPKYGLFLIGGPPGTGKSSAAVKLIDSMTRTGKTVGMISLEMTSAVYKMRWLEINPNLKARQAHRLLISDVSYNLDEACEAITRLVDRVPDIHAIFIDFADLLVVLESTENSSQIYVKLAALAKKLVVKIFLITQLSRNYVGGIPHATDIRWSGLAEATASLILMVYNPDQLFVDQGRGSDKNKLAYIEGMAYIIEAKSRFGYYNGGTGAEMIQWGRETGWGEEGEGWTPLHG